MASRSNTIYDQVLTPDGTAAGAVTAPALSTLRFDVDAADEAALLDWYRSQELRRLQNRRGFRGGRLCRQGPPHPVAPSRDPRWFAINEWENVGAALADGTEQDATARIESALPGRVHRLAYNVGRRHFRLGRPAV